MKTDYKPGDEVIVVKGLVNDNVRIEGAIFTVRQNNGHYGGWQLEFVEAIGLDYRHVRPLTKLEKALR